MAMLVLLETLSPDERAVFVLREVFGFDYGEIADGGGQTGADGTAGRAPGTRTRTGAAEALRRGRPATQRADHRAVPGRRRPAVTWRR